MEAYLVVHEDNSSQTVEGLWELEAYLDMLEENDVEYRIFEQSAGDCVWEGAEFYCDHAVYMQNSHGGWEERCENMGNKPGGCEVHRP